MKKKKIIIGFICLFIFTLGVYGSSYITKSLLTDTSIIQSATNDRAEWQEAFRQVAYAYYQRGKSIQYNSAKTNSSSIDNYFSPEDATPQNVNYMVCSGFVKNVYKELFNINVPPYTSSHISYAKTNIGSGESVVRKEIIAFGGPDSTESHLEMKIQKLDGTGYDTLIDPTIEEIYPYLQIGDILTYTGHTMVVYGINYTSNPTGPSTVNEVYIMESVHGNTNTADPDNTSDYIRTKIPKRIAYTNSADETKEFLSSGNYYLYHNLGSIHYAKLRDTSSWKTLNNNPKSREYSILRFVTTDEDGKPVLNYIDSRTGEEPFTYNDSSIELTKASKSRASHINLFIEKTVDAWNGSVVDENQELTYTLTIKNGYNFPCLDVEIVEELSPYVTYISSTPNGVLRGNKLSWTLDALEENDPQVFTYKVKVKEGTYNKQIISTGKVYDIKTSTIVNTVGNNLVASQKEQIVSAYNNLKDTYNGKELIDKIYESALNVNLGLSDLNLNEFLKITNPASSSITNVEIDENNKFYNALLTNYWNVLRGNERTLKSNQKIMEYFLYVLRSYQNPDRRADTIYPENFQTGDILLYNNRNDVIYTYSKTDFTATTTNVTNENGEYAYIFIEGIGFVGINPATTATEARNNFNAQYYVDNSLTLCGACDASSDEENYQTLFGKDNYVILRPAFLFNKMYYLDGRKVSSKPTGKNTILIEEDGVVNNYITLNLTSNKSNFVINSGDTLTFLSNGPLTMLTKVLVNGIEVPNTYYSVASGSTILTLSNDYLKNLSQGQYTIQLIYGESETPVKTFEIVLEAPSPSPSFSPTPINPSPITEPESIPDIPNTHDIIYRYIIGIIYSLLGIVILLIVIQKTKEKTNNQ